MSEEQKAWEGMTTQFVTVSKYDDKGRSKVNFNGGIFSSCIVDDAAIKGRIFPLSDVGEFNFSLGLALLNAGGTIRRKAWAPQHPSMRLKDGLLHAVNDKGDTYQVATLRNECVMGLDWVVVE